jgi:BCD family chlorophyll transporter-like MFS transporter
MKRIFTFNGKIIKGWQRVAPQFLPFADAATKELPLGKLLRLALFQISIGMATVLLTGTLNRIMIVELAVPAWLVGLMVSLPVVFAPFRALIGYKSDTYKSVLGWKRVPYIWFGTMMQFGGFAIMPFALLLLSGDTTGPMIYGQLGAGLAFLLVGAGINTTQTAGLALANDLAPEHVRPRVVALLFTMLLVGMVGSAVAYSYILKTFNQILLIQLIQGVAMRTIIFNGIALWQMEPRRRLVEIEKQEANVDFRDAWSKLAHIPGFVRLMVVVGLGTAAFNMQDILLEPFAGQVFGMAVGQTTFLMAILAGGMLIGFMLSEQLLNLKVESLKVASIGLLIGAVAFGVVAVSPLADSVGLFRSGTFAVGIGAGLFSVGTLTTTMGLANSKMSGILLGTWGGVQATCAGVSIAFSGAARDLISRAAQSGSFGPSLNGPATGYIVVFILEIALLFATLFIVGPLLGSDKSRRARQTGPSTAWEEGRVEGYREA